MSDLKKMTLTVKNYNLKASSDIDALYDQVRCEDSEGKTFHFKEVAMLDYLKRHGAIVTDSPRTWYYKHLNKKSIVLVAFEKGNGKVEYDLDHMRLVGLIIATATYGVGLLFIPVCFFYSYRSLFKIPKMLRCKTLVDDLATHGIVVR